MRQKTILSPSFFIGKKDKEIISFGSGQPDLPPPKKIYETLLDHFNESFKYGLIQGEENLRNALSKKYSNSLSSNFLITNGASEALDLCLRCLSHFGKKRILLPRPYYYSYPFNVVYTEMQASYYDLIEGHIDLNHFENLLDSCDVVLINSPSNPAGSVQKIETLKEIEALCNKKGIYIISDEVYKDLIYERENYLIEGQKVITINSFSKTFGLCGVRIGYAYCREQKLMDALIEMKTHTSMNTSLLSQKVAFEALSIPNEEIEKIVAIWQERRNLIYHKMIAMGLELWKPEGAFYVFPKFKNPQKVVNDLYYNYKIIAYNGNWFGSNEQVRFSYALSLSQINEGLERLQTYLDEKKK